MKPKLFAAALLAYAQASWGAVQYSGTVNIAVPNNPVGLYLNVINGSTYTGPNFFPDPAGPGGNWDINLFGSTAWGLFPPGSGGQSAPIPVPSSQKGYVAVSVNGQAANLAPGTLIGPASVFNTSGPDADFLSTGSPALLGFRFRNELNTPPTAHYGWARVILTAGQPGVIRDYAWESVPDAPIGAGVIPEPTNAIAFTSIYFFFRCRRHQNSL
jgi:hypothetical protein